MFKILNITTLKFMYTFLINLDLDKELSTQTNMFFPLYFLFWETVFLLFKCTKIDWSGSKWTEWIEYEQSGPNGLNKNEWTK